MHLDYRCYFKFRREDQWRKALQRLTIEGSDRQDYTFLEIGKMFSNLRRMMELMNTPMGQIFDTVESSEIGKYYFIHDHKKPRQYFPDLTQYIFEELVQMVPGDFILIADITNFDDDSMGEQIYYYCGGEEALSHCVFEDMNLHDEEIVDLWKVLEMDRLSAAQKQYLKQILDS